MAAKPYKIWSADRQDRKSLVAKTLEEVSENGCRKLKYDLSAPHKLVVEEDGTEVDEEEYFQTLKDDTVFILLKDGEKWRPPGEESGTDAPDSGSARSASSDSSHQRSFEKLVGILKTDITQIITFSNAEMESVAQSSEEELCKVSGSKLQEVQDLQLTCQRYLDDREKAMEAMDLLKLVAQSQGRSGVIKAGGDNKLP